MNETKGMWVIGGVMAYTGIGGRCIIDDPVTFERRCTSSWKFVKESLDDFGTEEKGSQDKISATTGYKMFPNVTNIYNKDGRIEHSQARAIYIGEEFYSLLSFWTYMNIVRTQYGKVFLYAVDHLGWDRDLVYKLVNDFAGVHEDQDHNIFYQVTLDVKLPDLFMELCTKPIAPGCGALIQFVPRASMVRDQKDWDSRLLRPTILNVLSKTYLMMEESSSSRRRRHRSSHKRSSITEENEGSRREQRDQDDSIDESVNPGVEEGEINA